jgi:hypothetical protein
LLAEPVPLRTAASDGKSSTQTQPNHTILHWIIINKHIFYDSTHFNVLENCTCIQLEIKAMFWTLEVTFCISWVAFCIHHNPIDLCTLLGRVECKHSTS